MEQKKTLSEMTITELHAKFKKAKIEEGKITVDAGKYFITVAKTKKEIPANMIYSPIPLGEILKNEINVRIVYDDAGHIIIIIVHSPFPYPFPLPTPANPTPKYPCYHIICYIPAPDKWFDLDKLIRLNLVTMLKNENILPQELAKEITNEIEQFKIGK